MPWGRRGLSALGAALAIALAPAAGAENINVSRIATGTFTQIDFAASAAQPTANGATISYFDLGTAGIDTEAGPFFAIQPWTAALAAAPSYPNFQRQALTLSYMQGNAQFEYDRNITRYAAVNMAVADPKIVQAEAYPDQHGGVPTAKSVVTYRIRVDHTGAQPLDYFLDLNIPTIKRTLSPAYSLCCSGDDNGGTYDYFRPTSFDARAEVDIYVDGLPVWSSASSVTYPADPQGTPFDTVEAKWGKPAGPGSSTLYLGRLSAGQSLIITFEAKADARAQSQCGIEPPGSYLSNTYTIHCLDVAQTIQMNHGSDNKAVSFNVYAKAPV
jgi:hypothetical protein